MQTGYPYGAPNLSWLRLAGAALLSIVALPIYAVAFCITKLADGVASIGRGVDWIADRVAGPGLIAASRENCAAEARRDALAAQHAATRERYAAARRPE